MISQIAAPLAFAVLAGALAQSHDDDSRFLARAATRTGHLRFDAGVESLFPLFTPLGEIHWAKGWNPEIVFPRDRDVAQGMVFRTRDGVEYVWTLVSYDPANHTVAYNVVAHDMLVRSIQVRCRPAGPARTEVEVTDSYVGLSAQGNQFIEQLTEAAYGKKMAGWQERIADYLAVTAKAGH